MGAMDLRDVMLNIKNIFKKKSLIEVDFLCYFRYRFLVLVLCLSFTSHFSPFILDPLSLEQP